MTFIFIINIKDADQNVKNKKSYKDNLTVFFKKKYLWYIYLESTEDRDLPAVCRDDANVFHLLSLLR